MLAMDSSSLRLSLSILTDLNIKKAPLDASLFPGVPSNVEVHEGFRDAHGATASTILAEVKNLINSKGAHSVMAVSFPVNFMDAHSSSSHLGWTFTWGSYCRT